MIVFVYKVHPAKRGLIFLLKLTKQPFCSFSKKLSALVGLHENCEQRSQFPVTKADTDSLSDNIQSLNSHTLNKRCLKSETALTK